MITKVQEQELRACAELHREAVTNWQDDETVMFACFVVIDFKCYNYPSHSLTVTEDEVKQFVLDNRELAKKTNFPTFVGMFTGVFDFFMEANVGDN